MALYTHITPNVIKYYGESENDLAKMPTTTKVGESPYESVLAPEGSKAEILTENGLKHYILRSTGWVEVKKNKVKVMTQEQWNTLTTEQKQSYGLIAIQESTIGYTRGKLINGIDYMP
jgi:hypothetical protein